MGLQLIVRLLAIAWASPYTLIGILIGGLGLCTGGRLQFRSGVIEFYGGAVKWLIRRLPGGESTLAMTLGHSVLGQSRTALDICREHELVHVRQYQRWGPFMGPAYLLCSLVLWFQGRRPYRDNPFEREAYGDTHQPHQNP